MNTVEDDAKIFIRKPGKSDKELAEELIWIMKCKPIERTFVWNGDTGQWERDPFVGFFIQKTNFSLKGAPWKHL